MTEQDFFLPSLKQDFFYEHSEQNMSQMFVEVQVFVKLFVYKDALPISTVGKDLSKRIHYISDI